LSQDRIHRTIRSATDATPEKEATMLLRALFLSSFIILSVSPHTQAQTTPAKIDLAQPQDYVLKRTSSFDRSGGNADYRKIPPGQTLTILDADGPATLTHIWFTLSSEESTHLKKLVLRMYWDHESTPSVETPLGDFFGLGLGDYYTWESELLAVAHEHALNSFFPMPFQKHALVTVTNEGQKMVDAFYFNLDYRALPHPLPQNTLYFHAQYRQAQPNRGWTNDWTSNGDPRVDDAKNLEGKDNYVWMEATGQGHYVERSADDIRHRVRNADLMANLGIVVDVQVTAGNELSRRTDQSRLQNDVAIQVYLLGRSLDFDDSPATAVDRPRLYDGRHAQDYGAAEIGFHFALVSRRLPTG